MSEKSNKNDGNYTIVGTNIDEVKKLNAQSGLSYNEVKELLARTTGGQGTAMYSNTDVEESKKK
ncbi:gamma-type small acid-soluble spore protein [Neobacillus sp. LXY-4]|uniref:gamma-type small acid-soluble spore protein n=1 Tax=Neobacillus sp. LXY-4 TaxID=3379826 RepID=UPI003EE147D6